MLTQERLKELVEYDPNTGIFVWKKRRSGVVVGAECGRTSVHGYREFCVDSILYRAHRLAFLYMVGEMPACDVDHINRDKADNSWSNLRLCTPSQNAANTPLKRSNKTGIKGVHFDEARGKWHAQIRIGGRKKNLGRFDNLEDAAEAYRVAAKQEFGSFVA